MNSDNIYDGTEQRANANIKNSSKHILTENEILLG
jgi:hypothetical protein